MAVAPLINLVSPKEECYLGMPESLSAGVRNTYSQGASVVGFLVLLLFSTQTGALAGAKCNDLDGVVARFKGRTALGQWGKDLRQR